MTLSEFIKSTQNNEDHHTRPRIVCKNGFSMSVQGGSFNYSEPRRNSPYFTKMEIGFPSKKESLLFEYAECPEEPTDCIYPYVPCTVIEEVINKHGGIKNKMSMTRENFEALIKRNTRGKMNYLKVDAETEMGWYFSKILEGSLEYIANTSNVFFYRKNMLVVCPYLAMKYGISVTGSHFEDKKDGVTGTIEKIVHERRYPICFEGTCFLPEQISLDLKSIENGDYEGVSFVENR